MIVCSCTRMTDVEMRAEIARLLDEDAGAVITPGRLFHGRGLRIECGGCCRLIDMMAAAVLAHHRGVELPAASCGGKPGACVRLSGRTQPGPAGMAPAGSGPAIPGHGASDLPVPAASDPPAAGSGKAGVGCLGPGAPAPVAIGMTIADLGAAKIGTAGRYGAGHAGLAR